MTLQELLDALEARFARIDAELETAAAGDRERLRQEIVGLFRETEGAIDSLSAFKERIRALVDRYKALPAPAAPPAPQQPQSFVADHIGSSTYVERGWTAIAAGDPQRAVKELERALELAPNNPLARVNLGYICLKKGIFGEAIEHLSRAIRQETDRKARIYAHFYMGLLYLEREMYDDARSFFGKTLDLGPNMLEAWWETGRAWYLEGRTDRAKEAWRTGHQANRFNLWGERCGKALAQLEAGEPVSVGA
jgi:tetratricopeptide (TPR) repeat protein